MRYNHSISISRFFQDNKYADSIELQNKLVILRSKQVETLNDFKNKKYSQKIKSTAKIMFSVFVFFLALKML